MNTALTFTRVFFFIVSVFLTTTYVISWPTGDTSTNALIGIVAGALFGTLLVCIDLFFRRFNLRAFNTALIGTFIGYLMGQALVLIFNAMLNMSALSITLMPQTLEIAKIALFLFGIYLGLMMTLRASDEFYVSIPFIKLSPMAQKKKDLLVDISALYDARLIDLSTSGLLNHQLVIPRFIIKELYACLETEDEFSKTKARRALDVIKKLESLPDLGVRIDETDFPEVLELNGKMIRLARFLDSNILSADSSRVQMALIEGIRIINMHALSNSLKPLMQTGEFIRIKVQRYGKEPKQGVGYLDDGTMVVINGGGKFIDETIEALVLSVKHTTSGRMIFCNALDNEAHSDEALYAYEEDDGK